MESQSAPGPITAFLLRLVEDEQLLARWSLSRAKALEEAELSPEHHDLLLRGDFREIREWVRREVEEAGAGGAEPWMFFWMR
jgi:hypothetical protein